LKHDSKNPAGPRTRLDRKLKIDQWELPGGTYVAPKREGNAPPAWWDDDEEASQSFLDAVGAVNLG